jgi:hypothetical protein
MGATMTTLTGVLKEVYEDRLRLQLNEETTALRRIERTAEGVSSNVGGKYVVFPIHTRRNTGIGARLENEQLPTPSNQTTAAAQVNLRYLYGGVEMTGQTFELAKTNTQAFISAMDLEMQGLKRDLATDNDRQVYGDGRGAIATITAPVTAATFTIAHSYWLQLGELVDIYDTTGVTPKVSGRNITAITATTVTISGANVAVVATDIIVRAGSIGLASGATQREWTGLGKIVATSGALYNVTDAVWTANVDTNSGVNRPLSEGLMTNMVDAIRLRGGSVSVIFSNLGVRRAYANLLTQQRRFTNTQEFTGGFSGLAFTTDKGDIPLVVDTLAPPNQLYFVNEKEMKVYRESDWSFMDRDGSMWNRKDNFDDYIAYMYQYSELGVHRRNSFGRIEDITEG